MPSLHTTNTYKANNQKQSRELRVIHTTLEKNNSLTDIQESFSLNETSDTFLKSNCGDFPSNVFGQPPGQDTPPPRLNFNGRLPEFLVPLHSLPPADILLNNSDHSMQPIRTERFQCSKHSSSEEYLCFTMLRHVGIGDCLV